MLIDFEISSVSYAYPAVPGDDRAALASALGPLESALRRLAEAEVQAFVLPTCLRIEIAVTASQDRLDEALKILFRDTYEPSGSIRRSGIEAVEHLFRIVAGLESPVVGEREILTQFRHATTVACEHGGVNGSLRGLLDTAIATSRSAHKELPSDPRWSMAALAAGLTEPAGRVGVLGHGTIGRSVAEALLALPHHPTVEVFARRPETVDTEGVIARPLTEVHTELLTLPAVISATSAKTRLVPAEALAAILAERGEPLILIDMAMPPDFSPPAGSTVAYHNIDDLADLARDRIPRQDAENMVSRAATEFMHKIEAGRRTGTLIANLFGQADDAVDEVVERLAGRLTSPQDKALLEQAARTAARKVLHKPVQYLAGDGTNEAGTIAAAFGIDLDG